MSRPCNASAFRVAPMLSVAASVFAFALPAASQPRFEEQGGRVVMEVESASIGSLDWVSSTSLSDPISGANGEYYQYKGNDICSGPANDPLRYTFRIYQEGVYQLRLRMARIWHCVEGTRHVTNGSPHMCEEGDGIRRGCERLGAPMGNECGRAMGMDLCLRIDLSNDVFVEIRRTTDDTYIPFANRANNETDEQTKLFGGGQDEFGWGSRLDPRRGGQTDAKWNLAAGDYELIMYGRSQDCRVDKMIFHLDSIEFRQNQEGVDWVDDPETLLPPQPGGEGGNTGSAGGGLPTPSGAGGSANNGSGNGNSAGANAAAPSGGDPASTANAGTEDNGGCAVTRGGRGPSLRGWAALGLLGFLLGRRRSSP